MTYDTTSAKSIFRDFRSVAGRVSALSQPAIPILDFLKQFDDVNSRWPNEYEQHTVSIIKRCATFQAALLSRKSPPLNTPSDELALIALSLRCLVLTHEVTLADGSLSIWAFEDGETSIRVDRVHDRDPFIEISRSSKVSQASSITPKRKNEESLSSMLENLIQTTQRLMFRRKPQDWPLLLCTLCLLSMIKNNLDPFTLWMRSLRPCSQAMSSVFSTLCSVFEICSKMLHPLSDDWNEDEYKLLVNDDALLVGIYQWMHDEWLEGAATLPFFESQYLRKRSLMQILGSSEQDKRPDDYGLEERVRDFTFGVMF